MLISEAAATRALAVQSTHIHIYFQMLYANLKGCGHPGPD